MPEVTQTLALPSSMEAVAITVGAVSGALHARRRHMDVMGVLVVAFIGALGGGVIRDILLVSGPPVFLTSPVYLVYAITGAVFGAIFSRFFSRTTILLQIIDGLFMGVWVVVGAQKALANGLGFSSAILVAVVTAAGGGILRDLFCGEPVGLVRQGQWLAAAAILGAVTFMTVFWTLGDLLLAQLLCIVMASSMRMLSAVFDLQTPMPLGSARPPA
jgi:uncharacterized membrane protein YeiH